MPDRNWLDPEDDPEYLPFDGSAFQEPKKQETPTPLTAAIDRRTTVVGQRPVQAEPKWYQRLGAALAGAGAGYVNAAGRTRVDAGPAIEGILAPGHRRRLADWQGQVETADATVQGEQQKRAAQIQDLQVQNQAESLKSQAEDRRARAADRMEMAASRKAAAARQEQEMLMRPGVEEIRNETLEASVPSSVPGIPGQSVSVAKPQKDYRMRIKSSDGREFGVRSPEEMAAENAKVQQASWPTLSPEIADKLVLPPGMKVPPNEFIEYRKAAQGDPASKLVFEKGINEITGDMTIVGLDPNTGEQKTSLVVPRAAQKREPQGPQGPQGSYQTLTNDQGEIEGYFNPLTKEMVPAPKAGMRNSAKPASPYQSQAGGFYMRLADSERTFSELEDHIKNLGTLGQAYYDKAPYPMQSGNNQVLQNAQRRFTEARLRKESGAVIAPHEFENDKIMYFPRFGDGPKQLADKKRARESLMRTFKVQAGPRVMADMMGEEAAAGQEQPSSPQPSRSAVPAGAPAAAPRPQRAVNKQTGEVIELVNGKWVKAQ